MSATCGLPRIVVNFLKHMESHKDCLKWNIVEGSHKVTLTLSWNFHKNRSKETLWDRLQRTLKLSKSEDSGSIPPELSRFLHSSPKRNPVTSNHCSQGSPIRRHHLWRNSHSPNHANSHTMPSRSHSYNHQQRRTLYKQHSTPSPSKEKLSSRFSWPGASSPISIRKPVAQSTPVGLDVNDSQSQVYTDSNCQSPSTPDKEPELYATSQSSPSLTRSESSNGRCRNKVRLTYRSEAEITQSLEEMIEEQRRRTHEELAYIKQEWNQSIREWPKVLLRDEGIVIETPDPNESNAGAGVKVTSEMLQNCLSSCDKILDRNSTLIL